MYQINCCFTKLSLLIYDIYRNASIFSKYALRRFGINQLINFVRRSRYWWSPLLKGNFLSRLYLAPRYPTKPKPRIESHIDEKQLIRHLRNLIESSNCSWKFLCIPLYILDVELLARFNYNQYRYYYEFSITMRCQDMIILSMMN